jgi:hypothetical protein
MSARSGMPSARARTKVALAVGLVLLAIAIARTLSGSPVVVLRANPTLANGVLASTATGAQACQTEALLPGGTSAIRLTLTAEVGPRVSVQALSGARLLTSGVVGDGWTGGAVTIPVKSVTRTTHGVRICFKLQPGPEAVGFVGSATSTAVAARSGEGQPLPGRIKIEYLQRGKSSWWSSAPEVARRLGLGHAPSGTWIALLLVVSMGALLAGASWIVLKESQ